jgi:hypothetical protein
MQQRQQQLRKMRLLLTGVPLLQLTGTATPAAARDVNASDHAASPAVAAPAASNNSIQAAAHLVLPHQLPANCFSAAWQLPSSIYPNLPAVEATLKSSSSNNSAGIGSASVLNAAQHNTAGAAGAGRMRSSSAAAAGGNAALEGLPPMRGKRARILKDGSLTLIPYGHDESMLWLRRVHTFIGAVRCGAGWWSCV